MKGGFMNTRVDNAAAALDTDTHIPLQPASLDIWATKYQLKNKAGEAVDNSIEETYQRVAKALAEVEPKKMRAQAYKDFLWALEQGVIPAGRIISNASAANTSLLPLLLTVRYQTPSLIRWTIF